MIVYERASLYVQSKTTLMEQIKAYDKIIAALQATMLDQAGNAGFTEYTLDDGQTKIMQGYRSILEVKNAIQGIMYLRQCAVNDLNGGNVVTLVDGKNFIFRNGYGYR